MAQGARRDRKGVWLNSTNWVERQQLLQSLKSRREETLASLNGLLQAKVGRSAISGFQVLRQFRQLQQAWEEQEEQRSSASDLAERAVERAASGRDALRRRGSPL